MSPSLHSRRVEQEWGLLQMLATANPSALAIVDRKQDAASQRFRVVLRQTCGLARKDGHLQKLETHVVDLFFPEFFPSVPIEVSVNSPVFHPNVHPENGFVCLWNRFSTGDTVIEALAQLQRVISWELVNERGDHVMQPEAVAWRANPDRSVELPLSYEPLTKPEGFQLERTYARLPSDAHRRRLS